MSKELPGLEKKNIPEQVAYVDEIKAKAYVIFDGDLDKIV
jgi:hypothetical protein